MSIMTDVATLKTIEVKTSVEYSKATDLIVGAFEGGSNYWIKSTDWGSLKTRHKESPWKEQKLGETYSKVMSWCCIHGIDFWVQVEDDDLELNNITPARIERGVQTMANSYPRHFNDMMRDNDDATTSDVLLQCILYNEIVFG